MGAVTDYLVPLLLLCGGLLALRRKQDAYAAMLQGGREGLRIVVSILPSMVLLLSAFSMLRASGALDILTQLLSPVARWVGIPAEVIPLMLIRPLSGSAALAVGAELMVHHGVDSPVGLCCAVMLGSTETTFYTISVYFGACGISKTRYAVPAALAADLSGFLMACLTANYLL